MDDFFDIAEPDLYGCSGFCSEVLQVKMCAAPPLLCARTTTSFTSSLNRWVAVEEVGESRERKGASRFGALDAPPAECKVYERDQRLLWEGRKLGTGGELAGAPR